MGSSNLASHALKNELFAFVSVKKYTLIKKCVLWINFCEANSAVKCGLNNLSIILINVCLYVCVTVYVEIYKHAHMHICIYLWNMSNIYLHLYIM